MPVHSIAKFLVCNAIADSAVHCHAGVSVLHDFCCDKQGGLPGLIMRLNSDGHKAVQVIGPEGDPIP